MAIRVTAENQMRLARILFFTLTVYVLFLFNQEKSLSLKVFLVFSAYFLSYLYYLYTQYKYGKKVMKIMAIGALLLTLISVVGLKVFVFD